MTSAHLHQGAVRSLEPRVGLRVTDPAWPRDVWEVVQADGSVIYLLRTKDGRLWHHTEVSWRHAIANGYLTENQERCP